MLLCLFLLTRWMLAGEGRSPRDLGLDLTLRRAKEWLGGFVAGVALVAIWCVVVWLGAPFHWKPNLEFEVGAMAASFALLAASNTGEELFFRGYVFDRLIKTLGAWWAQTIVAATFAAWHIWQGVPWIAAVTAHRFCSARLFYAREASLRLPAFIQPPTSFATWCCPCRSVQQRRSHLYCTAIYHFNDECCCSSL
jgi:membrane protease YdiL (CAAX protease family)